MLTEKQLLARRASAKRCYAKLRQDPVRYAFRLKKIRDRLRETRQQQRIHPSSAIRQSASFSPDEIEVMAEVLMRLMAHADVSGLVRSKPFGVFHRTVVRMKQKMLARVGEREAAE